MMDVSLVLNGAPRTVACEPGDTLLAVLRREGCFSVRFGSDTGETGAAAVLLDGRLVSADVMLAAQAGGHAITTVESLNTTTGEMTAIQAAFVETGAMQSGYSAGAMILAAKGLLERNSAPGEEEIRDALSGVLDRETGCVKAVEAVRRAAEAIRGEHATSDASPAMPHIVNVTRIPSRTVAGKPVPKVDAVRLVKGNASFTDDIDDAEARAMPGVHAVLHCRNTPRVKYTSAGQSWPNPYPWDQVSFDDKVRHVGDRVAAVAADTAEIAEEACRRIKVTYEILPAVFDEVEAISGAAPVIHDEPDTPGIFDAARNIAAHIEGQTVADIEGALARADHVFEQTFHVQAVQHCAIEPHIAIGWLDPDERLVIRSSTQVPFHVRRMVAPLIGLPVRRIRVIKPRIGGGFGSKQEMLIEDIVGHLVLATRRPVRLQLTREEEFTSTRTRHGQTITFRTGIDADGRLVAQDMHVVANTGAYGTHSFTVQSLTGLRGLSSYNCPAKRFTCDVAYTNRLVAGAMRGYGAPQAFFALESHMEDIARRLGLDPIELRRKNWLHVGDPLDIAPRLGERGGVQDVAPEDLPRVTSCGTEECVAQGMRAIAWSRRDDPAWKRPPDRPDIRRGIGFALCMQGSGIASIDLASCSIKINDDGSFNLLVGASDLGTGADTVLAQIAAEVLGVPVEDVMVYEADTDLTPFDKGAYASGTTYISGHAVQKAAEIVRDRITARAARLLAVADASTIELRDRKAWAPDGTCVSLEAIALNALHTEDQEQIIGTASHVPKDSPSPFGAQFAEVEVDVATGEVTAKKLVMAVDCGFAINPLTASGQVEGAMIQGLGYALTEELVLDDSGRVVNGRLGPYWIYRADDVPATEVYLVQTMEPTGPLGAKAIGEIPILGVAPAVRNAVLDATGVSINSLPLTPERVWAALRRAARPLETETAARR